MAVKTLKEKYGTCSQGSVELVGLTFLNKVVDNLDDNVTDRTVALRSHTPFSRDLFFIRQTTSATTRFCCFGRMEDPTILEIYLGAGNCEPTVEEVEEVEQAEDLPPDLEKPTLMSLPNEILLDIVTYVLGANIRKDGHDYLQYSTQQVETMISDCTRIRLTNKRFSELLKSFSNTAVTNSKPHTSVLVFLKLGVKSPELAQHVKYIEWKEGMKLDQYIRLGLKEMLEEDPKREGLRDLNTICEDTLAKVLQLTLNIRCLNIKEENTNERYSVHSGSAGPAWLKVLAEAAVPKLNCSVAHDFQHLHSLQVSMGSISLEFISSVLPLPSLRFLRLTDVDNGFKDNSVPMEDWKCPPRTSRITSLAIVKSFIDFQAVVQLISSMKALEHFEFKFYIHKSYALDWWKSNLHREFPKLRYADIGAALREHKDTLKTLKVLVTTDTRDPVFPNINTGSLGSLHCMDKLEEVSGPFQAFFTESGLLVGVLPEYHFRGTLPVSISHLELYTEYDDAAGEFEGLKEVKDACATSLQNLKKVVVNHRGKDGFINNNGFKFIEAFQKEGVSLRLRVQGQHI
ncbi:hypothetical protein BDV96DRAFT_593202 [Lophiotrema nucula]|uniref:F-box domain-containing protein n=1 Tax=Lophiotrema nucula TaxID=690887 RepID=A0A6A5ZUE3_9PLEO|nr:hypothetical protein BDV96DRAFT_593202 [Lophiotrema nucula]